MDFWIEIALISFGIALVLTGAIIPEILTIAFRRQLFDSNSDRHVHKGLVPRLGGIAFFPTVLCSMTFVVGYGMQRAAGAEMHMALNAVAIPLLYATCSLTLLYLVGIADDLVGVRYRAKFVVQILCAILMVIGGVWIHNAYGLLWLNHLPSWLGWALTAFMVVFIVNAINLIDGIDGLASGLSALALGFYGWAFYVSDRYIYALMAWTTLATLTAFFYFNVFGKAGKRNKIFMGDTGSLTIGIILAFLSIELCAEPIQAAPGSLANRLNPLMVAFAPLIVPMFDVVRVSLHRIVRGRNPFLPDRSHIHHKLLAMGLRQSRALLCILGASAVFIAFNIYLSPYLNINLLVLIDVVVWSGANYLLSRAIRRREQRLGHPLCD